MTDKEKILQEIERLQKPTMDANHNFTSDYNQGLYDGLSQLELFIDSLPEEKKPIREYVSSEDSTLGKLLKEMKDFSPQEDLGLSNEEYNDVVNELIFGKEEPVSEDLKQVIHNAIFALDERKGYTFKLEDMFMAGAEWQKEHIITKACGWLENHNDYICGGTNGISWYDMQQLVKDFRKAMKRE